MLAIKMCDSRVCLSLLTQSKIRLYIRFHLLLLLIIEGGGYGFGDNIQDVLFQKVVLGPLLVGLQAIVHEMSYFLAVVRVTLRRGHSYTEIL